MKSKKNGPARSSANPKKEPRSALGSFGEILKGAPGFDRFLDQLSPSKPADPSLDRVLPPKPAGLRPPSQSPTTIKQKKSAKAKSKNQHPAGGKKSSSALPPVSRSRVHPSIYAPRGPVRSISDSVSPSAKLTGAQPPSLRGQNALDEVKRRVLTVAPSVSEENSDACNAQVDDMVARGSALFRANPHPATNGYLVGFDFGSSATKQVLHKPYIGTANSYPIIVPQGLRATSNPHCWQTAVWFEPQSQKFSLTPKPAHEKITGFKSAIVLGREAEIANSSASVSVTFCEAAIAYLSMMVAHTLADYKDNMYFGSNCEPWFGAFFFGYPSVTDQKIKMERAFAPVFWAAFSLVGKSDHLTLHEIKSALLSLPQNTALKFPDEEMASPFYARRELDGLIAGYRATHDSSDGAHILIDIGATTLDIAYVRLLSEVGKSGKIYASRVETLGAAALEWFRQSLPPADDRIFLAALSFVLSEATAQAKSRDRAFDRQIQAARGAGAAPVIKVFCGGGQSSEFHKSALRRPESDIYWNAPSRSPKPELFVNGQPIAELQRLLVAWGLARDLGEFPKMEDESSAEVIIPKKNDFSDRYVGPEQM